MATGKKVVGAGPLFENGSAEAGVEAPLQVVAARGFGALPVAIVGGVVALGLWGAWVTKNVIDAGNSPPIARVQLSSIVGEYVQAQARSSTPPDRVTAETKAFMSEVERNLKMRGDKGQVVLVGEAVLAGDVPDITADLRRDIYKKVKMPQAAAAANDVMGSMRAAMVDPAAIGVAGGQGGAVN
jgi:hypothetical protein